MRAERGAQFAALRFEEVASVALAQHLALLVEPRVATLDLHRRVAGGHHVDGEQEATFT